MIRVSLASLLLAASVARAQPAQQDWAALGRYAQANAELPPPSKGEQRVVFMGNSITQAWAPAFATQFPGQAVHRSAVSAGRRRRRCLCDSVRT
jgi:hypothetical protein